ncbi:MAG: hypothetical protein AB4041_14155 [Microcystaceae cyanobacterium]
MKVRPPFKDFNGVNRICWLCVLMEKFVKTNSLEYSPLILSGMTSVINAPVLKEARQAIFNLRQLMLDFTTDNLVQHAITIYNEHHYQNSTEGVYKINSETKEFKQSESFLENSIIEEAKQFLSQPLGFYQHPYRIPSPQDSLFLQLENESSTTPINLKTVNVRPPQFHNLQRQPKGKITIPLSDLKQIAKEMDTREEDNYTIQKGNWENRLNHFILKTSQSGEKLEETDSIELEKLKHLIGLPGSGKTTLLTLMAIWLGQNKCKTMLLFPSIEVARQYMTTLKFHQVKVGMLVGQSQDTLIKHANNLAESIAAMSEHKGFGQTIEGAENFALNCVLPAFATNMDSWEFSYAPCNQLLKSNDKKGKKDTPYLCPLWTMCGRKKTPRDLIHADIWVGHVLSMDTEVPYHATDKRLRYFELLARTFDVVIFDEADMVQDNLDNKGVASLGMSGTKDSLYSNILEQVHNPFSQGENHQLFSSQVLRYTNNVSEFGQYSDQLINFIHKLANGRIGKRYEYQLLTTNNLISDLLSGFKTESISIPSDTDKKEQSNHIKAASNLWTQTAYEAFYNRTGREQRSWKYVSTYSQYLKCKPQIIESNCQQLFLLFRDYLNEDYPQKRDEVINKIRELFLKICFLDDKYPPHSDEVMNLLIRVTFLIMAYKRIVPQTKTMIAEELLKDSIIQSTPSDEFRKATCENILGSFAGVRYRFSSAKSTRNNAKNIELHYLSFAGAPRMLLHRFHELYQADNSQPSPAVLFTSATSFLEESSAYHLGIKNQYPHYLLKPNIDETEEIKQPRDKSRYVFKPVYPPDNPSQPLRYSGAGEYRNQNLEKMVESLISNNEIFTAIDNFDTLHDIPRKAALVVNSYQQARELQKHIKLRYPEVGKCSKAVVKRLEEGETSEDFITPTQCLTIGDDENCRILIFPMLAIGRGVNIVFSEGIRERDAAIGTIYFLTRPHPTLDDMQLFYSLAGKATQNFCDRSFSDTDSVQSIYQQWKQAKRDVRRQTNQLLREPMMASRLSSELFTFFTANQMVAILQTIGRGMRNSCPVQVYFVDAAWAPYSANNQSETIKSSVLVKMRAILEDCLNHPDLIKQEIYQELYGEFLEPLRNIEGVQYPDDLHLTYPSDDEIEEDDLDDFEDYLEM